MSTTEVNAINPEVTNESESSAHLTTTHVTYRTYGAFDEKGQAKGAKKDKDGNLIVEGTPSVLSQTQTGKNWEEAEKRGATILNQNQYKFYTLADLAGFDTLVPSAEQRLFIVQKGLDALQTAAANSYQTETKDKNSKDDPDEFVYNEDTIDLREAINTPPKRKNLSDEEKFMKAVGGLNPDKLQSMLDMLKKQLMAQSGVEA